MAEVEWLDLLGMPYVENARMGDGGIDCYGLVLELRRRIGRPIPDIYNPEGGQEACGRIFAAHLHEWQELGRPVPGSVALIRLGRRFSHCAYVLNQDYIVHTWEESGGVVKERISDWRHRIVGFYDYVGERNPGHQDSQPV